MCFIKAIRRFHGSVYFNGDKHVFHLLKKVARLTFVSLYMYTSTKMYYTDISEADMFGMRRFFSSPKYKF